MVITGESLVKGGDQWWVGVVITGGLVVEGVITGELLVEEVITGELLEGVMITGELLEGMVIIGESLVEEFVKALADPATVWEVAALANSDDYRVSVCV